jgi:hypothetical protein
MFTGIESSFNNQFSYWNLKKVISRKKSPENGCKSIWLNSGPRSFSKPFRTKNPEAVFRILSNI